MLPRIEAIRPELRPSERKLADYILAAPREVLDLAMTELSTRAGVSQPTIARFCQALGCSGFREFKIRLAQSVAPGVSSVYRDVEPDEPAPGIIGKVFDRTIGALIEVRNSLSAGSVADAIALSRVAHRVLRRGRLGHRRAGHPAQVLPARRAERRVFRPAYVLDVVGASRAARRRGRDLEHRPHARHRRRRALRARVRR
jgi:DNA-binding MurR/RpiR family transcriptional regulator